ncbi:predicted protein [Entamoeba histolytica]
MESLFNNQLVKEVVKILPNIQQSIDDTTKNYQYYLGSIKNEVFEIKENETYSEAIKRGEGIFDRIDEVARRRRLVIEKGKETVNKIKTVTDKMERIMKECNNDKETVNKAKNELIDKIIHMEEMNMEDKIKPLEEEINKITAEFNKKKEEWEKHYSDYLERKKRKKEEEKKKQEEERLRIMRGMNTMEEMLQIEEWTNRKVGNIIFDSDKDDWKVNTSIFGENIMNKEHIIIIIEDEGGNKFGGYVNEKIDKDDGWIYDSKSFVFSLKSKGRIKRMMKFDIKQPHDAFRLWNQSDNWLFNFGCNSGDICASKENNKPKSFCQQRSFEYKGISNALCGKEYPKRFTPKRIIVIEMK